MSILSDESRPLLDVGLRDGSSPGIGVEAKELASYRLLAVTWVALATIIRFVSIAPLPLANGEAYYATWSRFLDWSYYDHPPLVAWMVRLTTALGGSTAGIRLVPVLCAAAFGLLFYRLAERLFGPRPALDLPRPRHSHPGVPDLEHRAQPGSATCAAVGRVPARARGNARARRRRTGRSSRACSSAPPSSPSTRPSSSFPRHSSTLPSRRRRAGGSAGRPSTQGAPSRSSLALPVLLWNEAHGWPTLRLHLVERAAVGIPVAGENTINHLMEDASTPGTSGLQSLSRVLVGQLLSYSPFFAPALVVGLVGALRRARNDDRDLSSRRSAGQSSSSLSQRCSASRTPSSTGRWWRSSPRPSPRGATPTKDGRAARRFPVIGPMGVALSFAGFARGDGARPLGQP